MDSFLDLRTLIFVSGVTSFVLFACMAYNLRKQKTYSGFGWWILAALSNGAGMIMLSQQGIVPDFIGIIAANTLIIISLVFINIGLSFFAGARPYTKFYISAMSVFLVLYFYFTYAVPVMAFRFFVFSAFQATFCVIMVAIVLRDLRRVLPKRNYILFWFLVFCVAWPVLRAVAFALGGDMPADLMQAGFSHEVTFLGSIAAYIVLMIALIIINGQRVEQEMMKAKDEVKTITGLIPICATCKKIRDDQGMWKQLEAYLSRHADMEFSHALCPECMQQMYPEKTV